MAHNFTENLTKFLPVLPLGRGTTTGQRWLTDGPADPGRERISLMRVIDGHCGPRMTPNFHNDPRFPFFRFEYRSEGDLSPGEPDPFGNVDSKNSCHQASGVVLSSALA